METANGTGRQMLRHTVATVAYRGAKALRDVPAGFADFQACDSCRTPGKLLAHLGDLFDWALSMATGENKWKEAPARPWDESAKRFFAALQKFDDYLGSDAALACSGERLFQGPVADALAHVGQIIYLRRLAGVPIRSENYFMAVVAVGSVGIEQTPPKMEF
jgi:hypothetical protein